MKKSKECCICLEKSKKTKTCKQCKNAVICKQCNLSLLEKGQSNNCPLCRQENWNPYVVKINSCKIQPLTTTDEIILTSQKKEYCICKCYCSKLICIDICRCVINVLKFITLLFGAGVITLYLIIQDDTLLIQYIWLAFIIGIGEGLIAYFLIEYCVNYLCLK